MENISKSILILDSSETINVIKNKPNLCDFTFTLNDNIRNVIGIRCIECYIFSPVNNAFEYLDNIYIYLNEYDVVKTVNPSLPNIFHNVIVDKSNTFVDNTKRIYKSNHSSGSLSIDKKDESDIYYINPSAPVVSKFVMRICDKNGNKISYGVGNNIEKIVMKLCIYSKDAKLTMI